MYNENNKITHEDLENIKAKLKITFKKLYKVENEFKSLVKEVINDPDVSKKLLL